MFFISKISAQTYLCVIANQILEHHHQQIPAALSFCYNIFTWGKNRNHCDVSLQLSDSVLRWCPMWGSSCLFWVISKPIKPLNLKNAPFCLFPPPRVWNYLTWNQSCCHSTVFGWVIVSIKSTIKENLSVYLDQPKSETVGMVVVFLCSLLTHVCSSHFSHPSPHR